MGLIHEITQKERDIYFLREAFKVGNKFSQDYNTWTGSIIVNPNYEIVSFGANRMHFGFKDRYEGEGERIFLGRPEKYPGLTHGETDCIFCANRKGISLVGCTQYGTWTSCEPCSGVMANNGIARFVTHQSTTDWYAETFKDEEGRVKWEKSIEAGKELLKKAGVQYDILTDPIGEVSIWFCDKLRWP